MTRAPHRPNSQETSAKASDRYVKAALVADVKAAGSVVVRLENQPIVLFYTADEGGDRPQERIYAIDNRCPHMGFPLQGSTCKDGIVTCPWHYARFDLASGGTFDPWADDVRAFPVEIRDDEVWVNLASPIDWAQHHQQRLRDGLEQSISLVIAKSVIALLDQGQTPTEPFQIGLDFGTRFNRDGWDTGLTILTCMQNLMPFLAEGDRPRALYQGLSAVARDCAGKPPRFPIQPLPQTDADAITLKRWFRQFIELRDEDAAERCLVSAVEAGLSPTQLADMLFAAATDHHYMDGGHSLDFINKALEALDAVNWNGAETVLTSVVPGLAHASRMEETNSWRYPVDLVDILASAFDQIPSALAEGERLQPQRPHREDLIPVLLGDDPQAIATTLVEALRQGCSMVQLAEIVAYAAALRVAQFNTNNDVSDWNAAHHPFTFANAVHQGLRRVASVELLRGVFDAAMSVYLNRFLNVPPARLPAFDKTVEQPDLLLKELPELLNRQQQVNEAGKLVACYLYSGGSPEPLMALLGSLMLREDRNFHVIQELEAAFRQFTLLRNTSARVNVLVAATRYLAAHAPTMRSQAQTYQIADRLHRGDRLFEDSEG